MYPTTFRRPIPLGEWIEEKRLKKIDAAKHFDFALVTIQKLIAGKRDIGVLNNDELVETKEIEVVNIHADGQMIGYPKSQKIIITRKIKPRGPMKNSEWSTKFI